MHSHLKSYFATHNFKFRQQKGIDSTCNMFLNRYRLCHEIKKFKLNLSFCPAQQGAFTKCWQISNNGLYVGHCLERILQNLMMVVMEMVYSQESMISWTCIFFQGKLLDLICYSVKAYQKHWWNLFEEDQSLSLMMYFAMLNYFFRHAISD